MVAAVTASPDIWYLERVRLFRGIAADDWPRFLRDARRLKLDGRQATWLDISQGLIGVIVRGALKLTTVAESGDRSLDAFLTAGDVFGRIGDAGEGLPIETVEPTELLYVDGEALRRWMREQPDFAFEVVQTLGEAERTLRRRMHALLCRDVRARVVDTLVQLAREHGDTCPHGFEVDVRITQQDIADLVGAARQVVNRVLRELTLEMYLERRGRVLCILDLQRLAALAAAGADES